MLRLFDTAQARVVEVVPRDEGVVSIYVCGPTVYGAPHIGHGRSALVYDVLRRYLTWRGFEVRHASNITDIDDKIINRARDEDRPWQEVAAEYEAEWWSAMEALGVERPTFVPHATDYVDEMVALIAELVSKGHAYETADGVYLESALIPDYGLLSHQSLDDLRAGARVEVVEDKRSHLDFALWKKAKPNEPSWDSPFGAGRPGWHTECVVMSLALLGDGFDIHGGGLDLVFPHHENERAQAEAVGRSFAAHWLHNGFVTTSGEKMSKSLGNARALGELLEEFDPRCYRLLVLRSRYRSPLEATDDLFAECETAIGRIDVLASRFEAVPSGASAAAEELRDRFVEAMDDDLDTPLALSLLFDAIRRANALADAGQLVEGSTLASRALELLGALGLFANGREVELDASVQSMLAEMDDARAARDFTKADQLRAALEADGWQVENTPSGTRVRH